MGDDASAMASSAETRSAESSLLDHVERVAHNRGGRFAVLLHLSRLRPHNRKPYNIRIAGRSFDALLTAADVQLYTLSSGDTVLMCREVRAEDVDYAVEKVKALFKLDPLTQRGGAMGSDDFSTWFDLEANYDEFHAIAVRLSRTAEKLKAVPDDASPKRRAAGGIAGEELDPFSLAKVDDSLKRTRVADLVRRQPAVIIGGDGTERILFQEHFISITDLARRLAPGFSLTSNHWLFQHLTQTIDKRILATLARDDFDGRREHMSINLNISTLRSREFQRFDAAVDKQAGKIVVELQQIDVFSDLPLYAEARDWLRGRGYRVLLDGLNPLSLRLFDPGKLDADFVKVAWGEEFEDAALDTNNTPVEKRIKGVGAERFILARTDSEDALTWALSLGIRRFQGYFIDKLVERQIAKMGRIPTQAEG